MNCPTLSPTRALWITRNHVQHQWSLRADVACGPLSTAQFAEKSFGGLPNFWSRGDEFAISWIFYGASLASGSPIEAVNLNRATRRKGAIIGKRSDGILEAISFGLIVLSSKNCREDGPRYQACGAAAFFTEDKSGTAVASQNLSTSRGGFEWGQ